MESRTEYSKCYQNTDRFLTKDRLLLEKRIGVPFSIVIPGNGVSQRTLGGVRMNLRNVWSHIG